jgi:hypothetical protein
MMRMFALVGGPLDGSSAILPAAATQLKVNLPGDEVEFYVRLGKSYRMEFQPHPH